MRGQVATGAPSFFAKATKDKKGGTAMRDGPGCGEVQESRTSSSKRTISFGNAFWPLECAASLTVRPS